jgi:hypothetical protein
MLYMYTVLLLKNKLFNLSSLFLYFSRFLYLIFFFRSPLNYSANSEINSSACGLLTICLWSVMSDIEWLPSDTVTT